MRRGLAVLALARELLIGRVRLLAVTLNQGGIVDNPSQRMKVLCPLENKKTGQTHWMKIGAAFPNRDGSFNVYLDAYPANGKLQVRELDERDLAQRDPKTDQL